MQICRAIHGVSRFDHAKPLLNHEANTRPVSTMFLLGHTGPVGTVAPFLDQNTSWA